MTRQAGAVFGMLVLAHVAAAQLIQQGSKLVGAGAIGPAAQGYSVAISADGNTAIVGGWTDDDLTGAAWVYTRTGNVWSQQGNKLVGSGAAGPASQGFSVAISADGNTAIVGGWTDNSLAGAAWVFTRAGGKWSQQGSKLVGSGGVGTANQGFSVAIAADGNTAIVGGPSALSDSADPGSAWVFARSGGVWSQQGGKLLGGGAVGVANQGFSVAISGDGNTAIVGGPGDNATAGATWVFTRIGGKWSQQGSKLVGGGAVGVANQGVSVAISADARTAVVGGPNDSYVPPDSWPGAMWVFTRSGDGWSQQGGKMVGADAVGAAGQGCSVAISGDGNTAIVGGPDDSVQAGAAWVYKRSGGVWSQQGSKLIGSGAVGAAGQGSSVGISADGTAAIAGGFHDNSDAGAAWIFAVNGCAPPSITGQPQSQSIRSGQTATLSVTANGAAPLSYQWYLGASGDTSQPVGTDARSFTTPALTIAASYWVRVSNACGDTASVTATVSISCTPPSITTQPQSQTIASGQTITLSVAATGTALSYQWYQGASGDTSRPVGTNAASFTTPPLTGSTTYWVRVSDSCAQADSAAATVTVGSASAFELWVPVASHVSGLNQSEWRSDLALLNTCGVTANVQLRFFGSSVVTTTAYVAPQAQSILVDVVGQLGTSGSGAIEVLSDQPLWVTTRTYNQVSSGASCYPNGTQGQAYPVLATRDGLGAGQSAYLAGLIESASYRCNIGVVNTGTGSATVRIELYDGAGTKLVDYTVPLAPGQWAQETQPFRAKGGQTAMDRGYARITAQTGSGVFAFASVIDNITNDPTPVTMLR